MLAETRQGMQCPVVGCGSCRWSSWAELSWRVQYGVGDIGTNLAGLDEREHQWRKTSDAELDWMPSLDSTMLGEHVAQRVIGLSASNMSAATSRYVVYQGVAHGNQSTVKAALAQPSGLVFPSFTGLRIPSSG